MKTKSLTILILLFLLNTFYGQHPKIGLMSPPISIREWVTGEIKGVNPFRNKTVILEFWATWCAPCIAAIPHLNNLADKFSSNDVVFLSITSEELTLVENFLTRKKMKSSVVLDKLVGNVGVTQKNYGITGIPHTFLIDKRGILRWHGHPNNLTEKLLNQYFTSGKVPGPEQEQEVSQTSSSFSKDAFYTLFINRSQSAFTDPKLHGLGILMTRSNADTSEISYRGGSVVDFISKLLEQPTTRIKIDGVPPMESIDLTLRVTVPMTDSVLNVRAMQALGDVYRMKIDYKVEIRKGWALVLAFSDRLTPSVVRKGYSTFPTDSTWIGANVSVSVFARGLESNIKQHFFDETNSEGKFDFDVSTKNMAELSKALEQQYGIVLREVERQVQIIRLSFPDNGQY